MFSLRKSLELAHKTLTQANVDHALIGGLALATLGVNRATADVDFLIDGGDRERAQASLLGAGYTLTTQSPEVLHFDGVGKLDLLLANRPLSKTMLASAQVFPQHGIKCLSAEDIIGLKIQAYKNNPQRELQDKADIQALIMGRTGLDWAKIKTYADIFDEWTVVEALKK